MSYSLKIQLYILFNSGYNVLQANHILFFHYQNPSYKISDVGLPYDYDSVLHYGAYTFARDMYHPTITAKRNDVRIGRRHRLSKVGAFYHIIMHWLVFKLYIQPMVYPFMNSY